MELKDGGFAILAISTDKNRIRLIDPIARSAKEVSLDEAEALSSGSVILVTRRLGGAGTDPNSFGFRWFWPSILRYRRPLAHVLVASLFVQLFALASPLFFQLVVDKVLVHKGMSTLVVLIVGMVTLGLFETVLQFLRSYTLSHTTNRIDVELGRRLFHHLFRLPLAYFETRPAGQTVARMRELETIRGFLTGQGLTSLLDLVFTLVFFGVMFLYSAKLTLILLLSIPAYLVIAGVLRPVLREQINEKFNRGARSQQFLVESIVGAQTLKAAAVEPMMQAQWEERLASYVRTSFDAGVTGALGQNLVQFVSKVTTALILFFGAQSVIEGSMSVGELIAFTMIANQVVQPDLAAIAVVAGLSAGAGVGSPARGYPEFAARGRAAESPDPAAAAWRDRVPECYNALSTGRGGRSAQRVAIDCRRRSDWRRRPLGLGQVDPHQTDAAPVQPTNRPGDDRRCGRSSARSGLAQAANRRRVAGEHPLQSDDPRKHRSW
jgi:ATP-binding cassette, subfamily B, bacterial HlyB/CyaB